MIRRSSKPVHEPTTSWGVMPMNQPSAFSCVVPVLPATSSAETPRKPPSPRPVPARTTARMASKVVYAVEGLRTSRATGVKSAITLP